VGFTTGSRAEVPGKKENLGQEIIINIIIMRMQLQLLMLSAGTLISLEDKMSPLNIFYLK
jgi:hypothetical protein